MKEGVQIGVTQASRQDCKAFDDRTNPHMILLKKTLGMTYTPDLDQYCQGTTKVGLYFDMDKRQISYFVKTENSLHPQGFMINYLPRDIRISVLDPEPGIASIFTLEVEENCKLMDHNMLTI